MNLPDYSSTDCIYRGCAVLNKSSENRVLDSDEVNCLVRHYTGLAQRQQAAEEWWGGAVALDHFMTGLPEAIADLTEATHEQQHLFKRSAHSAGPGQLGSRDREVEGSSGWGLEQMANPSF